MKLWDLRKVLPGDSVIHRPRQRSNFDYRWGAFDERDFYKHPDDNSLVTFRGHRVLRTLSKSQISGRTVITLQIHVVLKTFSSLPFFSSGKYKLTVRLLRKRGW